MDKPTRVAAVAALVGDLVRSTARAVQVALAWWWFAIWAVPLALVARSHLAMALLLATHCTALPAQALRRFL